MKTGILSMQKVNNMGSVLQAYALKKMLENLGAEVSFVDIEKRQNDGILIEGSVYDYRDESDKGKKLDKYFFNRLNNKLKCKKQDKIYDKFRHEELEITGMGSGDLFDALVIGSDEVFNCLSASPWGFTSQLFGNVDNAKKVFTYAASCGATRYEDLPKAAVNVINEAFSNVSSFSARDINTVSFIGKFNRIVAKHLDPVLVYGFEKETQSYTDIINRLPQNYCILYSYQNRIHSPEEIRAIRDFAKRNNLSLISVGQAQFWLQNHYVMHPFEVINAFKNAKYVITDTFHGCILAAKYSNGFSVLTRKSNYNKLFDLANTLKIEKHLINQMTQLSLFETDEKGEIEAIIEKERLRTILYLKKELMQ